MLLFLLADLIHRPVFKLIVFLDVGKMLFTRKV